jgi:hypothetical protein
MLERKLTVIYTSDRLFVLSYVALRVMQITDSHVTLTLFVNTFRK